MPFFVPRYNRTKSNIVCSVAVRCRVVTGMMILSALLVCGRSASASCGSYLYRNGKPVSHDSMPMHELNGSSVDIGDTVPNGIPNRRCSGPNCSSSPLPLAPVPAGPSSLIRGFDQVAILESLLLTQVIRDGVEIPKSERGARFAPSFVFRPPAT